MSANRPSLLTFSLVALAACDTLATPDYQGESLLSLHGKVIIVDDRTEGALVPALAFENGEMSRLDLMPVSVRGEFPNSFALDVYTLPAHLALMQAAGDASFAIGYITAVSEDHEPFIRFANDSSEAAHCDEDGVCYKEYETCTNDDSICYRETQRCDENYQHCEVIFMEGDPSIRNDPWKRFAGLSENYRVLYLDADAPPNGWVADRFAEGAALSKGYHLLSVRQQTPDEEEAGSECRYEAYDEALAIFNEAQGTDYFSIDEAAEPCDSDHGPCEPVYAAAVEAMYKHYEERTIELRCNESGVVYTWVAHPERTPLAIRITPDVKPFSEGA